MRISVISPSFNQAQFLPFNLKSVSSQKHSDVEHIVVDPGSTDGSLEIAAKHEQCTLIAEPDRGQSDGICKGFSRSTGDVLTWLNSDDFYPDDNVLSDVARAFEANPEADVVYGNVEFVGEKGEFLRKGFVNRDAKNLLKSFEYQVGIVQPGVFMHRRVFEKVGGPALDHEYCMDYEYWVRIASNGFKWHFIDRKLAHHRWWAGMKTSRGRGDSLIEHFRVGMNYFGYIHHKWLDRYAEYLATDADGVVNHAATVDDAEKTVIAGDVVQRFVTQDALRMLERSADPEHVATLDYIRRVGPQTGRYFYPAEDIEVARETALDEKAEQRVAWNVFKAVSKTGGLYDAYHVPNNFDRYFTRQWCETALERGAWLLKYLAAKRRETCIIVGNGPSLRNTDLSLLAHGDVIISNFAIMHPVLSKHATILTMVNDLVAKQGAVAFNRSRITKVVPFWLANSINDTPETAYISATVRPEFNPVIGGDFSWRSTVSFLNMQLAFALGYKHVILVGFDHHYEQPAGVKEGDLIDQTVDDENHFDPNYFRGKVWQAADTIKMEEMYKLAQAGYAAAGRRIVNCTVGGRLEVFERNELAKELAR